MKVIVFFRIVKNSWIQCGGWSLPGKRMPCENYIIPHDRRGVLSMCNEGRHRNNSTQFFVTLAPAPWMDYKYVAFGYIIQKLSTVGLLFLRNRATSSNKKTLESINTLLLNGTIVLQI